jgi:integrase
MIERKEVPVRNNPGIYKRLELDPVSGKWTDTGKFRSLRRIISNGRSKKEQSVFDNIEDARAFRLGLVMKAGGGDNVHRLSVSPEERYTFGDLLNEWKSFHYLEIEYTSQQMYDSRIPNLKFLHDRSVDSITTSVINDLVRFWLSPDFLRAKNRKTFEKELDLLKVILNYYRRNKKNAYFIPVLPGHYRAADYTKAAKQPVRSLKEGDLGDFLSALETEYPLLYPVALLQLGLGLRIGEAIGLKWGDFDLERGEVFVQRSIAWNRGAGEMQAKNRKNAKVLEAVLPDFLKEVLQKMFRNRVGKNPFLFHRNGHLIRRQQVSKAYNRILIKLGVRYVSGTHMLRKTSGTLARKITRDVFAASKLLDHSSVSITEKHYQEQLDDDKQKVAKALNGVMSVRRGSHSVAPVPLCPPDSGSN